MAADRPRARRRVVDRPRSAGVDRARRVSAVHAVIEVVRPGPFSTVQDGGRHGWRHLGVGAAGAMDPASLALANRLVGNPDGAAAVEVTLGGIELVCRDATVIAFTGALGVASSGVRTYLGVRGGIDVEPVLGSRSFDTLGRIGPPPLAAGDVL